MKEEYARGLEYFENVWARVAGEPPAYSKKQPDCDEASLRSLIVAEAAAVEFYKKLAMRSGSSRHIFSGIASDEQRHLRHLQTEYYLLTGDSYVPPASCPLMRGGLSDLRHACLDEREAQRSYLDEAGRTEREGLAKMYRSHASEEARHAETLRKLIMRAV